MTSKKGSKMLIMNEKSSDECNEKTDNETGDHGQYEEISEADAEPK